MAERGQERRKYGRVKKGLKLRIINKNNGIEHTTTKDISPIGLRFETNDNDIDIGDELELKIEMPSTLSPVNAKAKVVWKKSLSEKDNAPFDIGCEFIKIEEDNKSTFLKFLFDMLHGIEEKEEKGEG